MAFSDEFIAELRQRNEICELVGHYVRLKGNGRTMVGLCPFHNEKTPSFVVYPDTQSFYCFGCGVGGEIISFIKGIENLDYFEAVKFLADRAGMTLPQDGYDDSVHKKKKRMLEANREAARFFYSMLMSDEGKKGLEYLTGRGLTVSTIRHFGLGYAPGGWHALHSHLKSKGFSDDELVLANLLRRKGSNCYDSFRDKVMFPIIDTTGNIIAFGGRVLDDSKPKYINTSDTLVYKKSEGVFALNFAKNNNGGQLVVVEGYMDVISLHQAGITNCVACLGTAFTRQQARLLSRYAKEIVISYDNDDAGRKATDKAIRIFDSLGIGVKIARLSGGKDPDEIVKKFGPERLKRIYAGAANDVEYMLMNARDKYDVRTDAGKVEFLNEVVAVLGEIASPIERDIYAGRIAQELEVDKQVIIMQVEAYAKAKKRRENKRMFEDIKNEMNGRNDSLNPEKSKFLRAAKAEERLISILMHNPDFLVNIEKQISESDFLTKFNARMYRIIAERIHDSRPIELSYLSEKLTPEELSFMSELLSKGRENSNTLEECMKCVDVIIEENRKKTLKAPSDMNNSEWLDAFNKLKN